MSLVDTGGGLTFSCGVSRAEQLAGEIKELQGEMADYNTVRTRVGAM